MEREFEDSLFILNGRLFQIDAALHIFFGSNFADVGVVREQLDVLLTSARLTRERSPIANCLACRNGVSGDFRDAAEDVLLTKGQFALPVGRLNHFRAIVQARFRRSRRTRRANLRRKTFEVVDRKFEIPTRPVDRTHFQVTFRFPVAHLSVAAVVPALFKVRFDFRFR